MPDQTEPHLGACAFCDRGQTRDWLLYEGRNFYVIADYAPVAEAHILLIPHAHYPHLASLPPELDDEFHTLKAQLGAFVKQHYGCVTYWENGVFGQSVPHAHLHSISVALDTRLFSAYGAECDSLASLRAHHAVTSEHYFLVEHEGVGRVLPPDRELYWSIITDAKNRNGGTWQYPPAERRVVARPQVEALIRRWREHHGMTAPAV